MSLKDGKENAAAGAPEPSKNGAVAARACAEIIAAARSRRAFLVTQSVYLSELSFAWAVRTRFSGPWPCGRRESGLRFDRESLAPRRRRRRRGLRRRPRHGPAAQEEARHRPRRARSGARPQERAGDARRGGPPRALFLDLVPLPDGEGRREARRLGRGRRAALRALRPAPAPRPGRG